MTMTLTTRKMMDGLRAFLRYLNAGPQADWERNYLCSMAPLSASALRRNEEAARTHAPH